MGSPASLSPLSLSFSPVSPSLSLSLSLPRCPPPLPRSLSLFPVVSLLSSSFCLPIVRAPRVGCVCVCVCVCVCTPHCAVCVCVRRVVLCVCAPRGAACVWQVVWTVRSSDSSTASASPAQAPPLGAPPPYAYRRSPVGTGLRGAELNHPLVPSSSNPSPP